MKETAFLAGLAVLAVAVPALAAHDKGGADRATMMKPDMSWPQMEERVKEHFAMMDANKDGAVTMDEIKTQGQAMRTQHLDEKFKMMDANGDGSISKAEFLAAHSAMREGARKKGSGHVMMDSAGKQSAMRMKMGEKMFERADANKDGKVTLAEAIAAARAHFKAMDADKNGTVTAGERMDFWKSKIKEQHGKAETAKTGKSS